MKRDEVLGYIVSILGQVEVEKVSDDEIEKNGRDFRYVIPDGAKDIIHEFATECRQTTLFIENEEKRKEFCNGMTVDDMFMHMELKCAAATTSFYSIGAVVLMMPFIDEKLRGEHEQEEG